MNFKFLPIVSSSFFSLALLSLIGSNLQAATFTGPRFVDTDSNGTISPEEVQTAFKEYYASLVAMYDNDGDGELSDTEKEIMRADRKAETLAIYDADGNGELSTEERQAIREARQQAIKTAFDSDSDGQLSENEGTAKDKALNGSS